MANKVATTTQNPDNSIAVTYEGTTYTFREPLGKDLVAVERLVENATDTESTAALLGLLSVPALSQAEVLDWPLMVFKKLSGEVNNFFLT